MAKYRIVTPAGASFTTAGGGYALESEALAGMDAEIVEAPTDTAGFIAAARTADAIYGKGIAITKEIIDALENCKVISLGSRRRRQRRREGGDRARHPGDQRPRHLHRGGRRPRHDAAAGRLPPPAGAGPHGARGPLEGRPPGAAEDPPADGHDARLRLLRPGRPRGGQARRALRPADDRLRPLRRGDDHLRPRRAAGDARTRSCRSPTSSPCTRPRARNARICCARSTSG